MMGREFKKKISNTNFVDIIFQNEKLNEIVRKKRQVLHDAECSVLKSWRVLSPVPE